MALAAMLLPALFLRACVVGTYVVTSPSMEPALLVEDHLLAWRAPFSGTPGPWELVLIEPSVDPEVPEETDALVKRVVSAPVDAAEFLSVRSGDLWVGPRRDALSLRRRPDALRDDMLVMVDARPAAGAPWAGVGFSTDGDTGWLLRGEPASELRFGRAVRDGTLDDPGHDIVRDTALELQLRAAPRLGELRLRLREGADLYEAVLQVEPEGLSVELLHNLGRGVLASAALGPLEATARVRFLNVDDRLTLQVDGETRLEVDVPPAVELPPGAALNNEPTLRWRGEPLRLESLNVLRDVHYTSQGGHGTPRAGDFEVVEVPPGALFLLGDDSPRSRDSRQLGPVPAQALLGRPFAAYAPAARRRWLNRTGL